MISNFFIFLIIFTKVGSLEINLRYPDDIVHSRLRREISDSQIVPAICKEALNNESKKKIERNLYPLKGDRNHDVSLVWLGDKRETQILLTTMKRDIFSQMFQIAGFSKSPSNVYRSTDGGKTFTNIEDEIGKEAIRTSNGIFKSPIDPKRLILVSFVSASIFESLFKKKVKNGALIITNDAGKTFKSNELPFKLRDGDSIRFHPVRKDWIIALEKITMISSLMSSILKKTGSAFISKDFGKTWQELMKNEIVEDIRWGTKKGHEDDIFLLKKVTTGSFLMHGFGATSDAVLYKSSNQKDFKVIVESCGGFGVQDEYVFASVAFKVGGVDKRIIHVSRDSGETFNGIHTPPITSDRFFAILEMNKGLIFLHVDEAEDSGKGILYISGPEGRVYEESLKDHFYTNSGFTDFFNIESTPGVYITQQLLGDKSLKSMITFDRGVKWQALYVDRKIYCQDKKYKDDPKLPCSLHYHHEFSKQQRHTVAAYVQSPLTSPKAPGLIILHGQAGDALTGKMNVWMSKNGGYKWTEIAKGPHHYAIGDAGNLIVLVPKLNTTGTTLKYSIDQGRCWHEFSFTDENQPLVLQGLVTEPHSQERSFSLWGYRKDLSNKERVWIVITVDFQNMFDNKCSKEDFEEWVLHLSNGKQGCFLGEKKTYKRPKEDKICYIGPDFDPVVKVEKCECTDDDIVCDYGYKRNHKNKCARDKKMKLMFCKDGEEELESDSKGYRLVPGDNCNYKESTQSHIKMIDQDKKCTKSEIEQEKESEVGIVNEEEKIRKQKEHELMLKREFAERTKESTQSNKKKKKNIALLVFGIVFVIGLVIAAAWYARKYVKLRSSSLPYVRSAMNGFEDENNDNDGTNHTGYRRRNENCFQDDLDADDEALLTV